MQALVLVGGEGTRLRPLTDSVPKPALTLVDRPFLAYMVEWLAAHGVDEVVLACGFLPDVLRARARRRRARRHGADLRRRAASGAAPPAPSASPPTSSASGSASAFSRSTATSSATSTSSALLRAHAERGARATIALHPVDDSSAYGLVECDADGAVLAFREKTGEPVPGEVNAGAYVLERSVLDLIPAGREVSIEREVFPRLVGEGLHALCLDGYWMDIGTPERYLQASWDILEGRVRDPRAADRAGPAGRRRQPRSMPAPGSGRGPSSRRAAGWRRGRS